MSFSNGVNGFNKPVNGTLEWKIGLVNSANKYLTAETFGFKINASAPSLRKKQLWTLEHDPTREEVVYIKSHLGRYLSGDKKGNVTCQAEEKGENEQFTIEYLDDKSNFAQAGKWAIRNLAHKLYFGGTDDNLRCYEKAPTTTEWWTVHLAVHPQVNMRNVNRKKYAHLARDNDALQCDELIPWGEDALINLEYRDGKYALRTCDNRFLHRKGQLVNACSKDTLFTLEIKSGQYSGMALKDCEGFYLTAIGPNAVMQASNKAKSWAKLSKDELFTMEDSHPQVFITAHNGKKVSMKQGMYLLVDLCKKS